MDPPLDRARPSWALPATVSIVSPRVCPSIMATITRTVRSVSFLHQTPASFPSFGLPSKGPIRVQTRGGRRRTSPRAMASSFSRFHDTCCARAKSERSSNLSLVATSAADDGFESFRGYATRSNENWVELEPIARATSASLQEWIGVFQGSMIHVAVEGKMEKPETHHLQRLFCRIFLRVRGLNSPT